MTAPFAFGVFRKIIQWHVDNKFLMRRFLTITVLHLFSISLFSKKFIFSHWIVEINTHVAAGDDRVQRISVINNGKRNACRSLTRSIYMYV